MFKRRKRWAAVLSFVMIISFLLPTGSFAADIQNISSNIKEQFLGDQVILKINGSLQQQNSILAKNKLTVIKKDNKLNYIWTRAPKGTNIDTLVKKLQVDPRIIYAQANHIYRTFAKTNDPLYDRQWALKKTNAEKAWNITKGQKDTIIAILDTGVDVNHPDLRGKLVPGTNTINPLKSIRDDDGHGTHVAGIVAATIDNGIGVAGVAGNSRIMPVKVFDYWGASDISVADGIIWAADHGAKVINMSFGTWSGSALLGEAIEYAHQKGVIMVAAAGNWASQNISYPAALSRVIAVSATDSTDQLAKFSSYGPEIDVSAPGEKIFSTFWDQHKGSTYCEMDGTSMAAPQVAALAALLVSKKPGLSSDEVRQIIESSAQDLGEEGWDPKYGHGRIDLYKALTTTFDKIDSANNTPDGAVSVQSGQPVINKVDYGFDEDWYSVTVPDKSSLQVELQPAGLVSPAMEIYNEEGEVIEGFNVAGTAGPDSFGLWGDLSQPAGIKVGEAVYGMVGDLKEGTYYIRIFGNHNRWSDACYTLITDIIDQEALPHDETEPDNLKEAATKIDLNLSREGFIYPSGDQDWVKVYLRPEKTYKIDLKVPAGLDLGVEIYQEDEKLNGSADGTEEDAFNWGYDFSIETIDYKGQGEDETGLFKVFGDAPGFYYLKIYDLAKGSILGGYTISVKEYVPQRDSYEPNDDEKSAREIKTNQSIAASFSSESDEDWYTLKVDKTGILKLDWEVLGILEPEVTLYNDEMNMAGHGDFWSWSDGSEDTGLPKMEFKVSPGVYYLSVANSWGAVAGNYKFNLELIDFNFIDREVNDTYDKAVDLDLGQLTRGTFYPAGDLDYYAVDVEDKGPVLLRIKPPEGIDSALMVYRESDLFDSEDNEEETREDSYLEFVTEINTGSAGQPDVGVFMAVRPGKYYIVAGGVPGYTISSSAEPYSLSVQMFNSQPDWWEDNDSLKKARTIGNNAVFSPTFMGTEDEDWYKIYIPAYSSLTVKLEVPDDIDGVLELYDSSGKLVKKSDQALSGEEESFVIGCKRSGIYYIKAHDWFGNASVQPYKLTVRYIKNSVKR